MLLAVHGVMPVRTKLEGGNWKDCEQYDHLASVCLFYYWQHLLVSTSHFM